MTSDNGSAHLCVIKSFNKFSDIGMSVTNMQIYDQESLKYSKISTNYNCLCILLL